MHEWITPPLFSAAPRRGRVRRSLRELQLNSRPRAGRDDGRAPCGAAACAATADDRTAVGRAGRDA